MQKKITAPLALQRDIEMTVYFGIVSDNAQWAQRARTPVLYDDLPTNAEEGWQAPITDSTTTTFRDVITGGGGNHVLGYFDGTDWRVQG